MLPEAISKLSSLHKRRKLFFIAILNTPRYKNRENAIYETWLSKFPRKIADFAFIRARIQSNESNVVWLKGVNDEEYPPQKKSFRLLNYFHKNLNYDWFVRMAWVFIIHKLFVNRRVLDVSFNNETG